jgi:sRNA-binding regulator protein Hfq
MAEDTQTQGRKETAGKFRPHGVQSDWLSQAIGQSVEISLDSGSVLHGRLTAHDIYCLALDEAGQKAPTLIYKHSIAFMRLKIG